MKALILMLTFAVSGLAHASGAVDYTCAGYVPGQQPESTESVSFTMTSANGGITLHIISQSQQDTDAKNADLTVDKTCKFTMDPDKKFPAYDVSVQGTCGTNMNWNFKGVCFFDL